MQPRTQGVTPAVIIPPYMDFPPDSNGAISGTLFDNTTEVECGGHVAVTWYGIVTYRDGKPGTEVPYTVTGASFNLDSATPNSTNPVVATPTGDSTYFRLDAGNIITGSPLPNVNGSQALGSTSARWDLFANDIDTNSFLKLRQSSAPTCLSSIGFLWYDTTNVFKLCVNGGSATNVGTVTSVAATTPTELSLSGSPITSSGTLAFSWANQSANRIFAGPNSGGSTTPTFRALVGADLPNPAASSLGGIQSKSCSAGQAITDISTSGVVTCAAVGLTVLDKQDVVAGINGNSADQTIYTYSMPSGTLASGKCLQFTGWEHRTSGAGTATVKLFFGGTSLVSNTSTQPTPTILTATVCNNAGSTTAQWGVGEIRSPFPDVITLKTTPAENTNSGSSIVVKMTFNVASGTSYGGDGWIVELLP